MLFPRLYTHLTCSSAFRQVIVSENRESRWPKILIKCRWRKSVRCLGKCSRLSVVLNNLNYPIICVKFITKNQQTRCGFMHVILLHINHRRFGQSYLAIFLVVRTRIQVLLQYVGIYIIYFYSCSYHPENGHVWVAETCRWSLCNKITCVEPKCILFVSLINCTHLIYAWNKEQGTWNYSIRLM
jgi:hypothetical protein